MVNCIRIGVLANCRLFFTVLRSRFVILWTLLTCMPWWAWAAQTFADKAHYLIDSLVLEDMSETDRQLIDSTLLLYHKEASDTVQLQYLTDIVKAVWDEAVWPKYNLLIKQRCEAQLAKELPPELRQKYLFFLAGTLGNLGMVHKNNGESEIALQYYFKGLAIKEELNNKKGIAYTCSNIGLIYKNLGQIGKSMEYYARGLKIMEDLNNKNGMATLYNNIGHVYQDQGEYENALEYYFKCLKIDEEQNYARGMATSYTNIGFLYKNIGNIERALEYYTKGLRIRKEMGDKKGIALSYNNIGVVYEIMGNHPQAKDYYESSLAIREELGDKKGLASIHFEMGKMYFNRGKINIAKKHGEKSLAMARELGYPMQIEIASGLASKIYHKEGDYRKAFDLYQLHIRMRDSVQNEKNQKLAIKQQFQYEYEKKEAIKTAENQAKLDKQKAMADAERQQKNLVIGSISGGLGLVALFSIFLYNRFRVTRSQKETIELQKKIVDKKNKEITDSIRYARKIQTAILPPEKIVRKYLKQSFILYKPKDIVAGDFYWIEQVGDTTLFAAADCTGHGVPGALVSVICHNAMNRAVREFRLTNPGQILDKVREIVIAEFEKSDEEVKDGMDIALCALTGNTLVYAGAYNPIWIIRNGEILETKASKQPIGKFIRMTPFESHTFQLQTGDTVYIFSDGYVDQFGGAKNRKFKAANLRKLLLTIRDDPMDLQRQKLEEAFESWRGAEEQVDDVCMIGLRI